MGLQTKDKKSDTASLGTLTHRGLEGWYRDQTDPVLIVQGIRQAKPPTTPEEVREYNLAEIMLRGYVEWLENEGADQGFRVLNVERQICVPIGDGIYITGKADLEILNLFDEHLLMDHKTVASIGMPDTLPFDFQLLTYAVLRRLEDGTVFSGAVHNQLKRVMRTTKANPPFYGRHRVHFNKEQLDNHEKVIRLLAAEIRDAYESNNPHRFPANPTRDCAWDCRFKTVCPMFDDGSDWRSYLEENYVQEGGD